MQFRNNNLFTITIEVFCYMFDNLIACYISIFFLLFSIFLVVCLLACFLLPKR